MDLKRWLTLLVIFTGAFARAEIISYRNAHPIGWMHMLPVGETPGWSTPRWFNLEFGQANVWNMQMTMTDTRNANTYTYKADYEQTSAIIDTGFAIGDRVGFSIEVPYANNSGGFLDSFIDDVHIFLGTTRFMREVNPFWKNSFLIQKNGQTLINNPEISGVGNIKAKLKWWLWQWRSPTKGACDCGLSVSAQLKAPTQAWTSGMTSGRNDYSALIHLGAPLGQFSGVWATSAVTYLSANPVFEGWPTRQWQQMYELTIDLGANANFGLILQARVESPFLEAHYLTFNSTALDQDSIKAERIASGWNSLVQWRGSESLGVRYRWGEGSRVDLLIVEDWGLGDRDQISAWNYVNNAPDVAFILKGHFQF